MSPETPPRGPSWSHLLCLAGGLVLGSWAARNQIEDSKKSRVEREDPHSAEAVYAEMGEILDCWEPDEECEAEDDFTQDLADWLAEETELEVEVYPSTREGKPDILIGNTLAIELKIAPSKGEMDRCVGQCAAYSRQWITWMVIVDATASEIGRLEGLLVDKGLEQLEVWNFS